MRTAIILAALVLCACNMAEKRAAWREEWIAGNPNTEYAEQIRAGRVTVGMTETEAIYANPSLQLSHQMKFEDGGWARTYQFSRTRVYVDDGFVTAVSWHGR